jgi:hypothetical protein
LEIKAWGKEQTSAFPRKKFRQARIQPMNAERPEVDRGRQTQCPGRQDRRRRGVEAECDDNLDTVAAKNSPRL